MFRPTDRQTSLLAPSSFLPESVIKRLQASWAYDFASCVYPVLLEAEQEFADLYAGGGRPNASVAKKLGVLLLAHLFDLHDQEALDQLAFDVRWQYALGLQDPADAYMARRTLVYFRAALVDQDPEMTRVRRLFDRIVEQMGESLEISAELQRLDSTHVTSNIQKRGRKVLFRDVLLQCLRDLNRAVDLADSPLPDELWTWFEAQRQSDTWPQEGGHTVEELAVWLFALWQTFDGDSRVETLESYQLVVRLIEEHCEIVEDDPDPDDDPDALEPPAARHQVRVRKKPVNGGASLQSAYDPDAGYGRKGSGYSVHLSETCGNDHTPEMITSFEVLPANNNDWGKSELVLNRLARTRVKPGTLLVDAGYPTPDSLAHADELSSRLYGRVKRSGLPDDYVGREAFDIGPDERVEQCPQGHAPIGITFRKHAGREHVAHAVFDGDQCRRCPLRGRCAVRAASSGEGNFALPLSKGLRLRDERLAEQDADSWQRLYRLRSGIEATNSELKRAHGMRKLRVRGGRRVLLSVALKVTACNIKRWTRAERDRRIAA